MNFALSDEQELLKEAARGTLSRVDTVAAAREALDGSPLPDLWPAAVEAGWPGLLVSEERGGAGLGVLEAMLVFEELGRVLASVPLLGHLPASFLLDRGGPAEVVAALVATADAGVVPATVYDATRPLGHVAFDRAPGTLLDTGPEDAAEAWYIAQALIGAESLGAIAVALEVSVAYAKERHTFGRPIGSYQAVKHELVEILRGLDNARSLMYYAGWAAQDRQDEFALAASAFRHAAGTALDHATRAQISVHGGIGATWEHDAPLYFRRAQLARRLLGGTAGAADRVACELLTRARDEGAIAAR
jgi:alkylation response protein AidB-like acyl-CoA dehydrogenase